ncbi:MAG TPA: 50S ribosomal protein L11 methyltransferase [Desulfuromonadaceae bacterium]|jgi:ribosomal protein L11 methyltransferase
MKDFWIELSCSIPETLSDIVAEFLTELSGSGVCIENLNVDAFSPDEITHASTMTIKSYFPGNADIVARVQEVSAFFKGLHAQHPEFKFEEPTVTSVKTEDWSNSWKSNFKSLRVGKRLLIVPSWEQPLRRQDDIVLRLDPGMAFGTGGHETTRLCLELLERIMDEMPTLHSPSVLDLGTGSGILAMAAVQLGAEKVCAMDIDPEAVEVARENLTINGLVDQVELSTTPLEAMTDSFDIILANILAEELVRLAPHLAARLKPGGTLVLSGILSEKEALVRSGFAAYPLRYQETHHQGEWVALLYGNVKP